MFLVGRVIKVAEVFEDYLVPILMLGAVVEMYVPSRRAGVSSVELSCWPKFLDGGA